jgi:hypothetical protein
MCDMACQESFGARAAEFASADEDPQQAGPLNDGRCPWADYTISEKIVVLPGLPGKKERPSS